MMFYVGLIMVSSLLILVLICYVVGSVPTGYWFCKYVWGIDITKHGSGNIGASNVARVNGKIYFFPVFFIDALKAYGTLVLCMWLIPNSYPVFVLCSVALLIGNAYSVFMNFRGGKGVATSAGIVACRLPWPITIFLVLMWLLVVFLSRRPVLGSLCSMFLLLLAACWYASCYEVLFFTFIAVWILFRHISNLS